MTHAGLSDDTQAMMAFETGKKSVGTAFLLFIFLGGFGAHRFYLGRTGSAVGQLILAIFTILTIWVVVGFFTLFALALWLFIDIFLISGIAREENQKLMHRLQGVAVVRAQAKPNTADELTKFAALRDNGAISAEEFEFEKRRLLGPTAPARP